MTSSSACNMNLSYVNDMDIFLDEIKYYPANVDYVDFICRVRQILFIHANNNAFNIDQFVGFLSTPRYRVNRLLLQLFRMSAVELIRNYRLGNACKFLQNPVSNISEAAYNCGFSDPKYFSRCFRKRYGVSPSEYRQNILQIYTAENVHSEILVGKAKLLLEKNIDQRSFNFDSFANELNVSKTTLYRRLKSATGKSPCEFIRSFRLKKSIDLLLLGARRIEDVALKVGFNDSKHFSRCFLNEFGVSPYTFRKSSLADY